jgi:hypothetical protein
MKFKNSAFNPSEGKIVAYSSVVISLITILGFYIPAFGAFMKTMFLFSGGVVFGLPYALFIIYVVKESVMDILQALGSELSIDRKEVGSDLKDIFIGDRDFKFLTFLKSRKSKSTDEEDDLVDSNIFQDFEDKP